MNILGIHTSYTALSHDPSASLISDGKVIAAIEEERLNRIKSSSIHFPVKAISECLNISELEMHDIDVVVSDGVTYPKLKNMIQRSLLDLFGYSPRIELVNHAYSHTAGAFLSSGFEQSLVISVDGLGDKLSVLITLASRVNNTITYNELYRADRKHSLGNYYTAFTNYLGFKSVEGEYKVMGMAAYGQDIYDLSDLLFFNAEKGIVDAKCPELFNDLDDYSSITQSCCHEENIYKLTKVKRPVYSSKDFETH